jgi:predicted amidohydrolase
VGGVQVAAVQVATTLDPGENRRLVAERTGTAAAAGAALVVFPEATMCGFGPPSFDLSSVAEPLDGPFVETVHAAAARHGVVVVAGMFERSEEPGRVRNTVVVAGPGGLLGAYRKLHLYDAYGARESDRVVAGDPAEAPVIFAVPAEPALPCGVMTCYDLRFPETARLLVDAGAGLLVLPAHWYNGPGKAATWETLVRARAIESTAYVVAAGKPEDEAVGRSTVVGPGGEVLGALGGKDDDVLLAEVSAARLRAVRAALPVLEHRRFRVVPR